MATSNRNSKNSALKLTPKIWKITRDIPTKHALLMRKCEQEQIKRGGLDFASEAKMKRLIARFLCGTRYKSQVDNFINSAMCAEIMALECNGKVPVA